MQRLLYKVVESVKDNVDMLRVRAFVEDGVEVDANLRVRAHERAEVLLFLPCVHRVALHEAVRLVALEPGLDEREQQTLRVVEPVARVEVAAHALGPDDE